MTDNKKEGYTKPDSGVRCLYCSDLLSAQRISAQISPTESILIATMARCINMGKWREDGSRSIPCAKIYNLKLTEIAENRGITKASVLNCVKNSMGNHFTLKELKQGYIDFVDMPKSHKSFEDIMNPVQDYKPDKFIEQEEAIF